jgi:hypothetical protein
MDLIYVGFAAIFIGVIAHMRGRSGVAWFVLTLVFAFGFSLIVYFYMRSGGTVSNTLALISVIPFLYGSPIATFLLLLAIGRGQPPAKPEPKKADPLAAMTRLSEKPESEPYLG